LETRPEHFLRVLETGKVSTNIYLRRIHNFALDMTWLPWPVIVKRQWPKVQFKDKRAITWEEHQAIVAREQNPERKAFYQLAWHLGASQTDLALLEAENIDWEHNVVSFTRKKTGSIAIMRFDGDMAEILRTLTANGPLFPYLRRVRANDRATEFRQRCQGLGIQRCIAAFVSLRLGGASEEGRVSRTVRTGGIGSQQQGDPPRLRAQRAG
jgi:integrase